MRSSSYVKPLAIVCFVVSLAALLWTAYGVVGRFVPELPGLERVSPSVATGVRTATRGKGGGTYDVDRIVAAHLFGRAEAKKAVSATNAPETKLQLSLAGLMSSSNEELARAMISVNRGKVKSYRVGQQIEGTDAVLSAIQSSDALLDRNGSLERLPMKRHIIASMTDGTSGGP